MQTACNTLPSPAEFDRLTANQFQSVRDIEADLNAETECARELKSPRAKALMAVGLESKAWRDEICGSKRIRRCPNHPDQFEEQHRTCRLKTCSPCAPRLAEERIARFWDNQPYMRNLKHFYMIHIHAATQDEMPSKTDFQTFNDSISKWIKKHGDVRSGTGAISHVAFEGIGPDNEHSTLKQHRFRLGALILWWGELPIQALKTTLGCIEYSVEPASRLRDEVKRLLTIIPPKSYEVCAQFELNTQSLRLIRSHGQMLKKDLLLDEDTLQQVPEALVAEEGYTATNATQPASTPTKCCKKCSGPLSQVSNWIDRYTPTAELKNLTWTIINNNPSPG